MPPGIGKLSAPAATDSANVIFACGIASLARASQFGADCAWVQQAKIAAMSPDVRRRLIFITKFLPKIISGCSGMVILTEPASLDDER